MNVMRGEWKYRGLIIDDALTGGNNDSYSNGPAMIASGTDLFCLDGGRGGQLKTWVTQNNDGTMIRHLQRANKYVMYAISRSWMGGIRVSANDIQDPWWKKTVTGLVIGTGSLAAILVGVYAFFEIANLRSKNIRAAEEEESAAPQNAD